MYKVTIPINMNIINEETLPTFLRQIQACRADRVFIGGMGWLTDKNSNIHVRTEDVARAVTFFRNAELEVGIWITTFRHGSATVPPMPTMPNDYVQIEGVKGDTRGDTNCPLDENFVRDYLEGFRKVTSIRPDLIMLDDDFRMNSRSVSFYMGCFCKNHLREYYRRIGEEIPREEIERLVFTGGRNKYRTAYLEMMADTLLGFAKTLRDTVNETDRNIRLGVCAGPEMWDYSGTDPIAVARVLAGDTQPFFRLAGAPYWDSNIIGSVETNRLQFSWCRNSGCEVFSEGDTFPRPRYNVPSKSLELFDLILYADKNTSGELDYLIDYSQKPEYETGYVDRFVRNLSLRDHIREMFRNKTPLGIPVSCTMHKIENWELGPNLQPNIVRYLEMSTVSPAREILSKNSIPTTYDRSDYPLFIAGENARYVTKEALANGAILDVSAADILMKSGIDTGLLSSEKCEFSGEYYIGAGDTIPNISGRYKGLRKILCHENARVLSLLLPDKTPGAYLYENADGIRFYVLAFDLYAIMYDFCVSDLYLRNFLNNYYRQADLAAAIEWIAGKALPAFSVKHPNLYILASKGNGAMSVALANVHLDDVFAPEIRLDKAYSEIRFVNCTGTLDGDKVTLSDIPPYGFAAFEVK